MGVAQDGTEKGDGIQGQKGSQAGACFRRFAKKAHFHHTEFIAPQSR